MKEMGELARLREMGELAELISYSKFGDDALRVMLEIQLGLAENSIVGKEAQIEELLAGLKRERLIPLLELGEELLAK